MVSRSQINKTVVLNINLLTDIALIPIPKETGRSLHKKKSIMLPIGHRVPVKKKKKKTGTSAGLNRQ